MLGRRSLSLPLISCDPDIEHTLRQLKAEKKASLSKENTTDTMARAPHVALQDHYTTPSCLRLPEITATHYKIKPSTIQSLPTFLGFTHENPYDFLSESRQLNGRNYGYRQYLRHQCCIIGPSGQRQPCWEWLISRVDHI
jgi:hypothetical protein